MAPLKQNTFEKINDAVADLKSLLTCRQSDEVKEGIQRELTALADIFNAERAGIYLTDGSTAGHMHCALHVGRKELSESFPLKCNLKDISWILARLEGDSLCCIDDDAVQNSEEAPLNIRLFRPEGRQYLFIKSQSTATQFSLLVFELPEGTYSPDKLHDQQLVYMAQVFANAEIHLNVLAENERQFHFEQFLGELSRSFIHLPTDQIDSQISKGLKRIVEYFGIDRSSLFQRMPGEASRVLSHFYDRTGITELPETEYLTAEKFPYINRRHLAGEIVYFSSRDELPEAADAEKETLKEWSAKSSLSIPLSVGGNLIGALNFGTIEKETRWPKDMINRGMILGEIFANALARKYADQKLRNSYAEIKELKERLQHENACFQEEIKQEHNFDDIIGNSEAIKEIFFKIEQCAPTNATVMLLGETGTGKELIARAVHNKSLRNQRPLIKVDCSALQSTLIERELFGHEKGAFTSAHQQQIGRFEIAHGGTLFLDEIGELPLELQSKLLRVIQDGEFERIGSPKTRKVDVRIISATNRDLEREVEKGRFRSDLWYRLNVFPITVPPLRERKEDIPLLVNWFVNKFSKKMGKPVRRVPQKILKELTKRYWAGNIRELENTIERAVIITQGENLTLAESFEYTGRTGIPADSDMSMEGVEREHILNMLKKNNWRISGQNGAARILKLNPSTLRFRMKKLGIRKPDADS